MTRTPTPGATKTRLMPLLGAAGAARLADVLLRGTLATMRRVHRARGTTLSAHLSVAPTDSPPRHLLGGIPTHDQGPGDLGARMRRAARYAFAQGCSRVVLLGSDCPLLTPDRLDEAFEALNTHDVVLGPASDGGYYLIGIKADHASLFEDITWGGPDVLATTSRRAASARLRTARLRELPDVDEPQDLLAWAKARSPEDPWLSVVIPALNEAEHLAAAIASAYAASGVEVIVADGGSTDRTREIARAMGARVVEGCPSRGEQQNAAAAHARGETLLFLHADTCLPPDYAQAVRRTLAVPGTAAGAFHLAIDGRERSLRWVEIGVRLRSSFRARPYGDQALFMRRELFDRLEGFPATARMEDYAMLARLGAVGRIRMAPASVRTSARRWQRRGALRTTLRHQVLIARHQWARWRGRHVDASH